MREKAELEVTSMKDLLRMDKSHAVSNVFCDRHNEQRVS